MYGTGKKKTSISRVFIKTNNNNNNNIDIYINNINSNKYFKNDLYLLNIINIPIKLIGLKNNLFFYITVKGGGLRSQAHAIKFGISKALYKYNEKYKIIFKKNKLLTRDSRIVERKKFGLHKSRKAHQFSKR